MLLEIRDASVNYAKVSAIRNISMAVPDGGPKGRIVTIIGGNGAGKTTTLRAISGLERLKSGEIHFDGERIDGLPADRIVARGIAHVPEGRRVFPDLTVEENLRTGAFLRRDQAAIEADLEETFERFPRLRERRVQLAKTMSGGEQQMLAIGRALTLNPKVLLLDEPTEGLAPIIVEELLKAIGTITRAGDICSIIVEQNAQKILGLADRVVILERGTIVHDAPSAALKSDPSVLERHLGVAGAAAH